MNKVYLKKYFKNMSELHKDKYMNKCVAYMENVSVNKQEIGGYLITDSYSIIKLNKTYDLELVEDNEIIENMFDYFKYEFCLNKVDITKDILKFEEKQLSNKDKYGFEENNFGLKREYSRDIKEEKEIIKYGIDMKRFNVIKNMIKANKFEIVSRYSMGYMYSIKLENTKTNEYAYLLPTRNF